MQWKPQKNVLRSTIQRENSRCVPLLRFVYKKSVQAHQYTTLEMIDSYLYVAGISACERANTEFLDNLHIHSFCTTLDLSNAAFSDRT